MTLPTIVSFWHGPLSWLEVLCITAFRRRGHAVHVYSYDRMAELPEGAEWRDAATILPRERLAFYKGKGTPAVFSDHFRLELLRAGAGIYSDLDVYCIVPIKTDGDYLMAWEHPRSVNNAVLWMPPDALLLTHLLAVFSDSERSLWVPHLPPLRRMEVFLRRLVGERLPPEHMQFGATGPMPLTHCIKKLDLVDKVRPSATFYPVPYEGMPALMQSGSRLDGAITPETLGIHLWRSQLTDRGRAGLPLPEPGSALAALCAAEGLDPASIR